MPENSSNGAGKGSARRHESSSKVGSNWGKVKGFSPWCCGRRMREVTTQEVATWDVREYYCEKCKKFEQV